MSMWALGGIVTSSVARNGMSDPVIWVALLLVALAALMLIEAVIALAGNPIESKRNRRLEPAEARV